MTIENVGLEVGTAGGASVGRGGRGVDVGRGVEVGRGVAVGRGVPVGSGTGVGNSAPLRKARIVSPAIAKPSPSEKRAFNIGRPISLPCMFTSAPPALPGLSAAS